MVASSETKGLLLSIASVLHLWYILISILSQPIMVLEISSSFFRKHKYFAVGDCFYVFRGNDLIPKFLIIYNKANIVDKVICDVFPFVVVITKAKDTLKHKSYLLWYFTHFRKIVVFLKFQCCSFVFDNGYLLLVQVAKMQNIVYQFIHKSKLVPVAAGSIVMG